MYAFDGWMDWESWVCGGVLGFWELGELRHGVGRLKALLRTYRIHYIGKGRLGMYN